ncbi:MAG: DotG/IcmE/VirB10 family protein [Candidatus Competibacteraceae bacterium]|nr:DotG/IcmE/VirB10 family protein [Candidatus Competibacteraceae bacterium]
MSQLLKVILIGMAVVVVLVGGWLLSVYSVRSSRDAQVQLTPVPAMRGTQPGDPLTPEHEGLRDYHELQAYREAALQSGSQSFVPDIRPLEPTTQGQLAPNPRWPTTTTTAEPTGPSERQLKRQEEKYKDLARLSQHWGSYTGHHLMDFREPDTEAAATGDAEPSTVNWPLTGKIHSATLLVGINSDIASPVVANLLKSPLAGATLVGKFNRGDEGVLIEFSKLNYQSRAYAIDAYAVDLDSATASVASQVNRRTVSRWAAVLGSALLGGLQRGALADSNVVTPGLGTVVIERDLDGEDIAAIAVGEIGRRTRPMAERYWNRPNTITVDEAVGIVFLSDVATEIQVESPAVRTEAVRNGNTASVERLRQHLDQASPPATDPAYGYEPTSLNDRLRAVEDFDGNRR